MGSGRAETSGFDEVAEVTPYPVKPKPQKRTATEGRRASFPKKPKKVLEIATLWPVCFIQRYRF